MLRISLDWSVRLKLFKKEPSTWIRPRLGGGSDQIAKVVWTQALARPVPQQFFPRVASVVNNFVQQKNAQQAQIEATF